MPVSAIPFKMPAPMEIPAHIVQALRRLPGDQAVQYGMKLLMQIDAAATLLYERVGEDQVLELGCISGEGADTLRELLEGAGLYGRKLEQEGPSLAEKALGGNSALLIMGQAAPGEENPLPAGLAEFLGAGGTGSIGFSYVLPLQGEDGKALGALTLIRPAASGPLNHEQPNIVEALRRELSRILGG